MLKKTLLAAIGIFLLLTVINLTIGILFWLRNVNRKPLVEYTDAPYLYFIKKNKGFDIDSSISKKKDSNEIRILMLGGSVANSLTNLSFSGQELYWHGTNKYLQTLLQNKFPSKKISILNGALPAYVIQQEFLAFQMYLQYYNPDIVIGLHGFNDVESFRVNHLIDTYRPSPLFYAGSWNSPIFNIVELHKQKYEASEIFRGYYNHIEKGYWFAIEQSGLKKTSSQDVSDITQEELEKYAMAHVNIVDDLEAFCRSKGMNYLNFLQPARFYHTNDSSFHSPLKSPVSEYLSNVYYKIEKKLEGRLNHFSLTHLDADKLKYTDECHPDLQGYRYMADSLAVYIEPEIANLIGKNGSR